MTTDPVAPRPTTDPFPIVWQRMVALSGVVFGVLLLLGFVLAGSEPPDYAAPDAEWTRWAADNDADNRLATFVTLIAGVEFLFFAGAVRTALGAAETRARGFARLARIVFAGALTGIAGLVLGVGMLTGATLPAEDAHAVAVRAVFDATTGPFLLASMGFAGMLIAAGLVTMRTGAYARWTAIVAFAGGIAFLVTFLTLLSDDADESPFGIGYPIGFLALVIWSIATSIANFRRVGAAPDDAPSARVPAR